MSLVFIFLPAATKEDAEKQRYFDAVLEKRTAQEQLQAVQESLIQASCCQRVWLEHAEWRCFVGEFPSFQTPKPRGFLCVSRINVRSYVSFQAGVVSKILFAGKPHAAFVFLAESGQAICDGTRLQDAACVPSVFVCLRVAV